jgi:DNA-binding transcriptional LysR family regulator
MSDTLALFQTFVRTVEAGSFTAVAREFHSSQPTVSRQIAVLEDHLGCLLFQRSTRALTLTDDGRTFYEHARRSLEAVAEAEGAVGRRKGKPGGTLRIACAGVFGRLHIIPHLRGFRARFPDVDIALHMGDGFVDLVEEGVDLAIRIGETKDSALIARRIGTSRRIVVASPDYIDRRGTPETPSDLSAHDCIVYDRLLTGASWMFGGVGETQAVAVSGPVHVNNTEGVRTAILQGLGIGYVPAWHFVENEIESGQLIVLLRAYEPSPQPISAVYPSRRYLAPKVRVAIDYLAAEFDLDPRLRIGDH